MAALVLHLSSVGALSILRARACVERVSLDRLAGTSAEVS